MAISPNTGVGVHTLSSGVQLQPLHALQHGGLLCGAHAPPVARTRFTACYLRNPVTARNLRNPFTTCSLQRKNTSTTTKRTAPGVQSHQHPTLRQSVSAPATGGGAPEASCVGRSMRSRPARRAMQRCERMRSSLCLRAYSARATGNLPMSTDKSDRVSLPDAPLQGALRAKNAWLRAVLVAGGRALRGILPALRHEADHDIAEVEVADAPRGAAAATNGECGAAAGGQRGEAAH